MTIDLDKKTSDDTAAAKDTEAEPTEAKEADATDKAPRSRGRIVTVVAVVVAVIAVVAAVVAGLAWRSADSALTADRAAAADRQTAIDTARAYTERSLTYAHTDLDGFFAGVEDGTTDALKERFEGVRDVLSQIMTQSQVVASGKVNAATVTGQDGDTYTVSVFATQTTQNLQQPEPGAVPTLLTVTVQHDGDQWLVTDYGADTGQ
jgi:Mce-associated membrane protein